MRIAEQLPEDDLGEPPSPKEAVNYHDALLNAHDELEIYPPYPHYVSKSGQFECIISDDYAEIEIKASLSGKLVDTYRGLDSDGKFELQDKTSRAIGEAAIRMLGKQATQGLVQDTVVLLSDLPVAFEPINNAMAVGYWVNENARLTDDEELLKKEWDRWQKKKIHIKSQFIESYDQQRLLLCWLAAFVTRLEELEQLKQQ